MRVESSKSNGSLFEPDKKGRHFYRPRPVRMR